MSTDVQFMENALEWDLCYLVYWNKHAIFTQAYNATDHFWAIVFYCIIVLGVESD
jgi:hypothetical protein